MALSVFTDTRPITAVRDPVWYELQCQGYLQTPAVAAVAELYLIQDPGDGDTFSLSFANQIVEFTFVDAAVDDSGTQVRIGADLDATKANLFAALQANWYINEYFSLPSTGPDIVLTARVPGVLPIGIVNTIPATLSLNQTQPGVDAVYAPNYTAVHQIWLETARNSNVYEPLPARDGRPDHELRVRWNLQGMLRDTVQAQWPLYAQEEPMYLHQLKRRYYITRYEKYGSPAEPRIVQRSAIKTAWLAGSRNSENLVLSEVFAWATLLQEPSIFLTYRGRAGRHEVSATQQSYLGWYRKVPKVSGEQLYVRATVYYSDDTTDTSVLHTDTNSSGWQQGDVILIPTGFNTRDLHLLQPNKIPTHYTVQVFDHENAALSEVYTYHLRMPDANELHVEWHNSLGVVESTRCVGQWVRGIRTEYDLVDRLVPARGKQPSPQDSQRIHHLRGVDNTIELSTGFMDQAELDAVLDMLYSRNLYIMDHERRLREPFIPLEGEYVVGQKGTADENLYALNLKGTITHSEMARSMRNTLPPLPTDYETEDPDVPDVDT